MLVSRSMASIEAVYDGSVLRPTHPLRLRVGERVRIIVLRQPDPARWDLARLSSAETDDADLAATGLVDLADTLHRDEA
jgi:predicted DNA-binding antitoxin AbrB/MazE fold protein